LVQVYIIDEKRLGLGLNKNLMLIRVQHSFLSRFFLCMTYTDDVLEVNGEMETKSDG